ncbi:MAG: RluA family pseudouridine synthase [Thiomonas sp.]|nr:RluA family pseudouridine synthase [Thiomonas sp.]
MHTASSPQVRLLQVGDAGDGQRLDNFLARHLKGVPRSHIYRIVRSGEVRVNGGRASADQKLLSSDQVRIPPVRVAQADVPRPAPAVQFPVVFEDDHLLAINKPEGVAVHGGSGVSFGVIEALRAARPAAKFLELVHRLDRDTSGLLLIAKKRSALTALHAALRERHADKRYLALVAGLWTRGAVLVEAPLHKYLLANGERRVRVDAQQGQESRTQFRPQEHFALEGLGDWGGLTLLQARLLTGRTHQIRVHLAHSGHPIVGDDKYGDDTLNAELARGQLAGLPPFKRMFLHAESLAIAHPATGARLELRAPLPDNCVQWLHHLRAQSAPS